MTDFIVTDFLFPDEAYDGLNRDFRLIGVFTCRIGPVLMERCRLRFSPSGQPIASLPSARDRAGKIVLATCGAKERILEHALAAFRARGGTLPSESTH